MTHYWDGREREEDVCSWAGCLATAEDEGWDTLIYFLVLTSPGEEGYAEVTQALCQEHYDVVSQGLMKLGFQSHNHHGTNPLEADCGYGECLTPADYGPELVGWTYDSTNECAGCLKEYVECGRSKGCHESNNWQHCKCGEPK